MVYGKGLSGYIAFSSSFSFCFIVSSGTVHVKGGRSLTTGDLKKISIWMVPLVLRSTWTWTCDDEWKREVLRKRTSLGILGFKITTNLGRKFPPYFPALCCPAERIFVRESLLLRKWGCRRK